MRSPSGSSLRKGSAVVIALLLATPLCADWAVHMGGNLGSTPRFARSAFDSEADGFKYQARGMELGLVMDKIEVNFFMDTINKGYINRGYQSRRCVTIGTETQCFPEGTYLDPVGVRLIGVKAGSFKTFHKFNDWIRLGVPFHVGATLFSGEATRVDSTINATETGVVARTEVVKVQGKEIINGARGIFPVFDLGLSVRMRTASWAEAEFGVSVQNFRLPALMWGMTLGKGGSD
jgi:hypothetical protein